MSVHGALVDAAWLQDVTSDVTEGDGNDVVILDVTWMPILRTGRKLYERKHIPSAYHFDLDACGPQTQLIPRGVPSADDFQLYARSFGINATTHVIVYDRDDGRDLMASASYRVWWLFRLYGHGSVSVLDGGLTQWEHEGRTTVSGAASLPQPGNFCSNKQEALQTNFESMEKIVGADSHQILDSRLPEHFDGCKPEPSEFTTLVLEDAGKVVPSGGEMMAGHMPNAKNISFMEPFQPGTTCLKPKEELMKLFNRAGIDMQRPLVATCYIGHTACLMAFIAVICDKNDVTIYNGSWTEWGQRKYTSQGDRSS